MSMDRKATLIGVLFAILASFLYAGMSVFVKLLGEGQTTVTVVFARFLFGFICLSPWFFQRPSELKVDHLGRVLVRCVTSVLAMMCMFYALKYLSVADALLLNNTFPLFLPLLSFLFLRIKTPFLMMVGIVIGFIGVGLILNPKVQPLNWPLFAALLSGFLAALALLQIRLLTRSSTPKQIVFYLLLFGTIVMGLMLPFSFIRPNLLQGFFLILIGLLGAFYQVLMTLSLKYAKASVVSPIYYSCILFSIFFDWAIWHKVPHEIELIGMGLIILGGILTIVFSEKEIKTG